MPTPKILMTAAEVRAALADRSVILIGYCRKGRSAEMPKTPENMRRPNYRTPLLVGRVEAVSGKGMVKFADDHGFGGWVPADSLVYAKDPL